MRAAGWSVSLAVVMGITATASAETTIRIMPPDGAVLAAGQRLDVRVEATSDGADPPRGLTVLVNGRDVTSRNILDPGTGSERGAGGTGATGPALTPAARAGRAAANTTNFLLRAFSVAQAGPLVIEARTADGTRASVRLTVEAWAPRGAAAPAQNIIFLLGDGMGVAHRTAARIVSRGLHNGRARGLLAMDTLEATGMVMTPSLNAAITDSSPGMAAYSTGQKNANNQAGVFPDNTADAFDNPRIEYIGALLRRTRGSGFNVGIVTTADVTDSTPAANAIHTSDRFAGPGIADRFFDERTVNGVTVLLGGGARHFMPKGDGGERPDGRTLTTDFEKAGYARVGTAADVARVIASPTPPARILGLFHSSHLPVAFDKVGAGRYSGELAREANARYRDTPMLEDMARLALRSLSATSPRGFYLMIEGASIDKRAHAVDAERTILGRHRVRLRGPGRARLREPDQLGRESVERHARRRHGRSRDRRPRDHRRRQRAIRAGSARPGRTRLRSRVSFHPRPAAQPVSELPGGRPRVSGGSGSVPQDSSRLGRWHRSQRKLDIESPAARSGGRARQTRDQRGEPCARRAGGGQRQQDRSRPRDSRLRRARHDRKRRDALPIG